MANQAGNRAWAWPPAPRARRSPRARAWPSRTAFGENELGRDHLLYHDVPRDEIERVIVRRDPLAGAHGERGVSSLHVGGELARALDRLVCDLDAGDPSGPVLEVGDRPPTKSTPEVEDVLISEQLRTHCKETVEGKAFLVVVLLRGARARRLENRLARGKAAKQPHQQA